MDADPKAVTHLQLVTLWMKTNFTGIPCIVFFDPIGDGERASLFEKLGITEEVGDIINSDIFILPAGDPDSLLNKLSQDIWGFTMSWDGEKWLNSN
jgi:hypothetical protein